MERTPRPNEIYRHFKGNLYRVITLAKHTETGEMLVIYQALYGEFEIYARPLQQFMGEVDRDRYPDAAEEYRFTLVQEIFGQEPGTPAGERKAPAEGKTGSAGDGKEVSTQKKESAGAVKESPAEKTGPAGDGRKSAEKRQEAAEEKKESAVRRESATREETPSHTEEELQLDPLLLEFLEADSYEEKLNILVAMHSRMTWEMLNTAAVSLDLELEKGEPEECYQTLKNCLLTLEKYECSRLR